MQIPSLLYGTYRDVKRQCQKAIKRYQDGQPWLDIFEEGGMTETANHPGLLILDGPSRFAHVEPCTVQFQCYLPLYIVRSDLGSMILRKGCDPSSDARAPVGCLGLVGATRHADVDSRQEEERVRLFLHALLTNWDLLAAEGPRYSKGTSSGRELWKYDEDSSGAS